MEYSLDSNVQEFVERDAELLDQMWAEQLMLEEEYHEGQ